ncbi:MAG: adenylosuccinate lyase [Steroidobacteraceae bacterium]
MTLGHLHALSPLDGRYASQVEALRACFSEQALIRFRIRVECRWLLHLAATPGIEELSALPPGARELLHRLADEPGESAGPAVKAIEARTRHDVKAVEYWLREQLAPAGATPAHLEFVHFGCTSEDINNLAYALMIREATRTVLLPQLDSIIERLRRSAHTLADLPMLSRTHGQPASPTTLGKELANVLARLERARSAMLHVQPLGKFNGAVGNYNAHVVAFPEVDWLACSRSFVEALDLAWNPYTTQIEPHDWIADWCHALIGLGTILTDLCRDLWGYVSLGYFRQRAVAGEVGSSTMPHKVNPIDFENAEGNAGMAAAVLGFLATKLPVSRWQRDLTDSTALRNLGVGAGHMLLAMVSLNRGLDKLEADPNRLAADLGDNWEVVGEAIQTVMRRYGIPDAYDKLKEFTRGKRVSPGELRAFIGELPIPEEARQRLLQLTPATYTGLAATLAADA